MKMREIAEGIYEVILHDKEKEVGEMRVHIVRKTGEEKSYGGYRIWKPGEFRGYGRGFDSS